MKQNDFQKVANQVSFVTIVVNILLAFMKLLAGVFAHSNAMISDSIHSASDVFSTMIVVIGIKLSSKQPDKEHPYGHEQTRSDVYRVRQNTDECVQFAGAGYILTGITA